MFINNDDLDVDDLVAEVRLWCELRGLAASKRWSDEELLSF